jgi:hypothetical protein
VFCFERKNLVVSFLTKTLSIISQIVELLDLLHSVSNLTSVALVNSGLVSELLSPDIDLASKHFVLRLQIVEFCQRGVEFVFKKFNLVLVLSHFRRSWSDLLEIFLLFLKLLSKFLFLVAEHHHMSKFKIWTVTGAQTKMSEI